VDVQIAALVNELNWKNATAFFTKAFERKIALVYTFCTSASTHLVMKFPTEGGE